MSCVGHYKHLNEFVYWQVVIQLSYEELVSSSNKLLRITSQIQYVQKIYRCTECMYIPNGFKVICHLLSRKIGENYIKTYIYFKALWFLQ